MSKNKIGVSRKGTHEYIESELFAAKGGLRLQKHSLRQQISSTTVHSWTIALGWKFDHMEHYFYADAHETSDVREYRSATLMVGSSIDCNNNAG